jgi:hypothetical protein
MKGAVLSRISENGFLLLHDHTNHIVEFHQNPAMGNSEEMRLMFLAPVWVFNYMFLHNQLQEIMTTSVHIYPTLSLLAFIFTDSLMLLVSHLLPSEQRLPLEDPSALLSDDFGECRWQLLEVLCLTFDVLKGSNCPSQIRDVDVVELERLIFQTDSNFFSLLLAHLGESSWLLPANHSLDIIFGLPMPRKE